MILHIASYYIGSKVYKNLISTLDKFNIAQTVYVPVRNESDMGKNGFQFDVDSSHIAYRKILSLYTRINFIYKIKRIFADVKKYNNISFFNIIHAHTLYSDGAVAFKLFKQYNIKYVVTVRSTDINVFLKYFPHLRKQAKEILLNANKIVFLSASYKDRIIFHPFFADCKEQLNNKSVIIPNGIDQFWLDNLYFKKKEVAKPPKLLYVGELIKRKNVAKLLTAVSELNMSGYKCMLNIVGKNGIHEKLVKKAALDNPEWLQYYGGINSKENLLSVYRENDLFIMPSINETFGLVYVEAISQGLPIVYCKNEGIDRYFDSKAGEALTTINVDEIKSTIKTIINNYEYYNFDPAPATLPFNWDNVAKQYDLIYQEFN